MQGFKNKTLIYFGLTFILLYSCKNNTDSSGDISTTNLAPSIPVLNYTVTKQFPHDTTLFTEGLLIHDGKLYESTGSPDELPQTKSLIVVDNLLTGRFDKKIELDKTKYFGEGIVFLKNKVYQLTYKNQQGFIYNAKDFKTIGTFKYSNKEGWSLTTDGQNLIMSDGTSKLTFLNPDSLQPVKTITVTENGFPLDKLNELEFIRGFIYANVWQTSYIVKIDTSNGNVVGKLDLNSVIFEAKNKNPNADVLNGVAYDSTNDKIYVTGKLWTNIYQINFPH
ncbi:MAG: glutaminyl-peptide cyclotransferase [Segetibacter sp.]